MLAGCAGSKERILSDERASTAPSHAAVYAGGDRLTGRQFATRSPVVGRNGMAATAQPLASLVAIDILRRGGTAVDAAIAANAALGLMEPTGCGIGGDLFAIVWDPATRKVYGLNASGRSARSLTLAQVKQKLGDRDTMPMVGTLSVTVPGTVDGWFELHERFGKLPMTVLLEPAIEYAEAGFPLTQVVAYYWARNFARFDADARDRWLEEFDNARAAFLVDGRAPAEGEVFRNPDLAATYRAIAHGGRDAFYRGSLAEVMVAYLQRIGGAFDRQDFADHRSEWVEPVSVDYRGHRVYELPPNTQGVAALQMLQILSGFDIASMGAGSADALHVQIEAKRLAFEDRATFYADPAHADVPMSALLADAYATERRALIDMARARPSVSPGAPALEPGDTTYLTVADKDGMMVSLIQSNYRGMGSGLVPDGLGFMLQDRGALFSLDDSHANAYAPSKRPFHTIIPGFATKDGQPWLSFGVMGGAMQPQGHVQILVNLIDFGMGVQEAGDAARYRHTGSSQPTGPAADPLGTVSVESGIPASTIAEIERRGHRVQRGSGGFGGYQAIMRDATGTYHGASEMRKDGAAIGY